MNRSISLKLWVIILGSLITIVAVILAAISVDQNIASNIEQKMLSLNQDYTDRKAELDRLGNEILSRKNLLDNMNYYNDNAEALSKSLSEKTQKKDELDMEILDRQKRVDSLKSEIELLENTIRVKQEEPTEIPAGEYTVYPEGSVRPGRYSVTGSSNFVVRSSSGDLKVNTILGDGSWGVDQYVCNLGSGDTIKASSRCILTPVEQ